MVTPARRRSGISKPMFITGSLGVALTLLVSGCAGTDTSNSSAIDSTPSATSTSSGPTTESNPTPSGDGGDVPDAKPVTPGTGGPETRLLAAAELPPLPSFANSAEKKWTQGPTKAATSQPFGPCAQFSMDSIGAGSALERTYTAGESKAAAQYVDFADDMTAKRATAVLYAWFKNCKAKSKLTDPVSAVSQANTLTLPQGKAVWYTVTTDGTSEPPNHDFAAITDGARMVLLSIVHDTGKPVAGEDPAIAAAAQAASVKMGS